MQRAATTTTKTNFPAALLRTSGQSQQVVRLYAICGRFQILATARALRNYNIGASVGCICPVAVRSCFDIADGVVDKMLSPSPANRIDALVCVASIRDVAS